MFWIVGLVDSVEMLTLNPTGFVNKAGVMGVGCGVGGYYTSNMGGFQWLQSLDGHTTTNLSIIRYHPSL
jgi:hypothetical protein